MNYNYKNLIGLAVMFALISVTIFACSDDNSPVSGIPVDENDNNLDDVEFINIPDERLLAQIQLTLEIESDEEITPEMMLDLAVLDIDASNDFSGDLSGISDLTGLEYALNLTYLRLSYTEITDLSPISDLENIEYLRFNNTAITDISPLSNFTNLTYFNANTVTGLTDISPLAGNTGLRTAILREVPFGNEGMSTLRDLISLYRINMRNTGVTDITILGEMMADGALLDSTPGAADAGGATLDLRDLAIDDWSPIESYVNQISNLDGYPGD
jgi:hypothetical protein